MYRKARPLFLICNTPTHVGSGSELGIVDLPIQRERHTGFPKFEGSSLKGSLREAFERKVDPTNKREFKDLDDRDVIIHRLFGYDEGSLNSDEKKRLKKHFQKEAGKKENGEIAYKDASQFAGALGFSDARILLFPVKSMKGVFAWATCLRVLKQFVQDMQLVDGSFELKNLDDKNIQENGTYLFSKNSSLKIDSGDSSKVVLEEYTFSVSNYLNDVVKVKEGEEADKPNFPDWLAEKLFGDTNSYWANKLKNDIVVLPDDDFKDFVNLSTEVITRTKIDNNTGTVEQGALFTEEYLPAESVMYSLVLTAAEFTSRDKTMEEDKVSKFFKDNLPNVIQIGGNATLGKGIVTTKLLN
ncbi:MAG: type III-B CRISPR module RAMP protein Cmr4 [Bacteroidia bacterium]